MASPTPTRANILTRVLAHLVGDTPTPANVTSTALMLIISGATLGTLAPELASGHIGPAITAFLTGIGINMFSGVIDRLRAHQEKAEPISQADVDDILALIAQTGLEARLGEADFQRELRTEFARLDVMADLIRQVPEDAAQVVVAAMNTRLELFTVQVVNAVQDAAEGSAHRDQQLADKLDKLMELVIALQGQRLKPREAVPPAGHLFISYAHADGEDFAQRLYDTLNVDRIPVWLDSYNIPSGAEWDVAIENAIEDCDLFVFVVTPGSVSSRVCKNEYTQALSKKKRVCPLYVQDAEMPIQLNSLNYIDFRDLGFDRGISALRLEIKRLTSPPISPKQVKAQETHAIAAMTRVPSSQLSHSPERCPIINGLPRDIGDRWQDRDAERSDITRMLMREDARLIGIYGRAGIGKTGLASKVLGDIREAADGRSPDGIVCLSETRRGASDSNISVDRIFSDFGKLLAEHPKAELEGAVREAQRSLDQKVITLLEVLRPGRYILLLDNMESFQDPDTSDLTDPALRTFLEVVLEHGGPLRIVVTSREPLILPRELRSWEWVVRLEKGLGENEALILLRALDPDNRAGLRDASRDNLVIIARQTEGNPRALEAIAGLLLEDEFLGLDRLLADGLLLAQEIATVIVQQAIARLRPDAIRVMEGLALYGRPVEQPALEFLLAPYMPTTALQDTLRHLARARFVSFNPASKTFALHPIDRDYCLGRIPAGTPADLPRPEDDPKSVERMRQLGIKVPDAKLDSAPPYTVYALCARAATFFRRQYEKQRKAKTEIKTIDDLEAPLAEFDYRVQIGDYDRAADLLLGIDSDYLHLWGYVRQMIALHERLQGRIANNRLAGNSVGRLGNAYWSVGRVHEAITCYEKALEHARKSKNRQAEETSLGNLGTAYHTLGQVERAIDYYQQALTIDRDISDRRGEGADLGNLGTAYRNLGQVERAIDYYQQALTITRAIGDRRSEGGCLCNLGTAYRDLGQVERAIDYYQQALTIARDIGDRSGEGAALGNLGGAYRDLGQVERAIDYHQQALTIARDIGNRRDEGAALGNLGSAYRALGQVERAIDYYQQALTIARDIGDRSGEGACLGNLGTAQAELGSFPEGIANLKACLTIAAEIKEPRLENYRSGYLAVALLHSGDLSDALDAALKGRAVDVPDNNHVTAAVHGVILARLGQSAEAVAAFQASCHAADDLLAKTPRLYGALYTRGLAHAGLALLAGGTLQAAEDDYIGARAICAAAGVVTEQLQMMDELMCGEGGAMLQPVRQALVGQ